MPTSFPNLIASATSITINGIQCWDEGVKESFGRTYSRATRRLFCLWANRYSLINSLKSQTITVGGVTEYAAPGEYPDAPALYVDTINTEGRGTPIIGPNGMIGFEGCQLDVIYSILDTGSFSFQASMQQLTVAQSAPTWQYPDGTPVPTQDSPPLLQTSGILTYTAKNLPSIPVSILQSLSNKVNSDYLAGFNPGTLLFGTYGDSATYTTGGLINYDGRYQWSWLPTGWNNIFRPSTGTYQAITTINGGNPPYGSVAFIPYFPEVYGATG